jgi:DNA repair protein RadA/Sms
VDFNRLLLIIAVLSKHAGLRLFNQDIIVSVTGGLRVNEPAADLAIALAIASCFRDAKPITGLVALGEVGLNGELRGVSQMERRISEAVRLGFKSCLMPGLQSASSFDSVDLQLIQARSLDEALHLGLTRESKAQSAKGENAAQE